MPEPSDGIRVSELSVIRSVDQAGDSPELVDDPFRTGSLRVTPDLDLRISKAANTQISAYVTIYPGARSGGVPALTFEFTRDGKVIGRSGVTLPEPDEGGRIKYVASFPTEMFRSWRIRIAGDGHSGIGERQFADAFRAHSMTTRLALIVVLAALAATTPRAALRIACDAI